MTARSAPLAALCLTLALASASLAQTSAQTSAQTPAQTSTLADQVAEIEGLLAAGRPTEALLAARRLYFSVGAITGLQLTAPVLVTAAAPALGVYQPREGRVYADGETVHAYAEATGFGMQTLEDGQTRIHLRMAFRLIDAAGRDQSGLVEMGEVDLRARAEPADVFLNLSYRITGAKGAHVLRTEVTDQIGGRTASFDLPVAFR
jgi:hypothetical protein